MPDRVIREGDTAEEILKLIDEDDDIGILVLAAGTGKEGPGPLVSSLAKTAGTFPIPVAIVPGPPERRRPRRDVVRHLAPLAGGWVRRPVDLDLSPRRGHLSGYSPRHPRALNPQGGARQCSSRPKPRPIRRR